MSAVFPFVQVHSVQVFYRDKSDLSPIESFNRTTQLSQDSHPPVLELPGYSTKRYRASLFLNRTARFSNNLLIVISPVISDVTIFKSNVHTNTTPCLHHSLPITLPDDYRVPTRGGRRGRRRHSLSGWS